MEVELSSRVAIATATLYNLNSESDRVRAELSKKTIKLARKLGYEIVVVDGGSPDKLLREFGNCGAKLHLQKTKGFGNSRREAIWYASNLGKDVIVWMEPEKAPYIPEIAKTVRPIVNGSADMVVPKRKSLKSYPSMQQSLERAGNLLWEKLTGLDLDVCFGPKAWRRELSSYFLDYGGEYGDAWGIIFIPVMDAISDGKRVISVEVDYTHPPEQTKVEEDDLEFHLKRIEQLYLLGNALITHTRKL